MAGGAEDDATTGESMGAEEGLLDVSPRSFDLIFDTNLLNPFFSSATSGPSFAGELIVAEVSVMYWFDGRGRVCRRSAVTMS